MKGKYCRIEASEHFSEARILLWEAEKAVETIHVEEGVPLEDSICKSLGISSITAESDEGQKKLLGLFEDPDDPEADLPYLYVCKAGSWGDERCIVDVGRVQNLMEAVWRANREVEMTGRATDEEMTMEIEDRMREIGISEDCIRERFKHNVIMKSYSQESWGVLGDNGESPFERDMVEEFEMDADCKVFYVIDNLAVRSYSLFYVSWDKGEWLDEERRLLYRRPCVGLYEYETFHKNIRIVEKSTDFRGVIWCDR